MQRVWHNIPHNTGRGSSGQRLLCLYCRPVSDVRQVASGQQDKGDEAIFEGGWFKTCAWLGIKPQVRRGRKLVHPLQVDSIRTLCRREAAQGAQVENKA